MENLFGISYMPAAVYYIPNFIDELKEAEIMAQVYAVPIPKWTQLLHRRLQNWGGVPHAKGMIAETIPKWLDNYITKVKKYFPEKNAPNHVLVNEYLSGQGIMPHTDGPLFHPVICTITCGSHAVLNFQKTLDEPVEYKLLLERRSLVILTQDLYHNYLHSIAEIKEDIIGSDIINLDQTSSKVGELLPRSTRVSLTIRHVPSVAKFKLKLSR